MAMWRFLSPSMLGFTTRNLGHGLVDALRREPPRPVRAAAYVREHAAKGDPKDVLAKLDDFATNVRWLMSIGPNKEGVIGEARSRLAGDIKVLELGAYAGYSSIYMADTFGSGAHITSVEVDPRFAAAARSNIEHAGLSDRVTVLEGKSSAVIPTLEGPFDLVFLDHWKDLYRSDLERIEEKGLLRPGSVVVADNVGEVFGADRYLEYVRSCGRYESEHRVATIEYTSLPDAVEISVFQG